MFKNDIKPKFKCIFKDLYYILFNYCMCVCACAFMDHSACVAGSQRRTFRTQFSPFMMWIQAWRQASSFTHWTVLLDIRRFLLVGRITEHKNDYQADRKGIFSSTTFMTVTSSFPNFILDSLQSTSVTNSLPMA